MFHDSPGYTGEEMIMYTVGKPFNRPIQIISNIKLIINPSFVLQGRIPPHNTTSLVLHNGKMYTVFASFPLFCGRSGLRTGMVTFTCHPSKGRPKEESKGLTVKSKITISLMVGMPPPPSKKMEYSVVCA